MNDDELLDAIRFIKETGIFYFLNGSSNLRVQGMSVDVRDVDINTDANGLQKLRDECSDFIVKDFYNSKISVNSIILDVDGIEIEVNEELEEEFRELYVVESVLWRRENVNILPLRTAKRFYEKANKPERVKEIDEFLEIKQRKK